MRLGEILEAKGEKLGLGKEVEVSVKRIGKMLLIRLSRKIGKSEAALLVDLLRSKVRFTSWRFTPLIKNPDRKYIFRINNNNYELIEIE